MRRPQDGSDGGAGAADAVTLQWLGLDETGPVVSIRNLVTECGLDDAGGDGGSGGIAAYGTVALASRGQLGSHEVLGTADGVTSWRAGWAKPLDLRASDAASLVMQFVAVGGPLEPAPFDAGATAAV